MRKTKSRRNICLHPGQTVRCTIIIKKKIRPNIWIRLRKTQMAKIMVQYGRSSRSSRKKSARSSFSKTIMGKALRESFFRTRMGKSSMLALLIRWPKKKRTILISACGWYTTGCKETEYWPNVENAHERRWFWENQHHPWPRWFGLHAKRMSDKQRYFGQLQEYVRIQDLCRSYSKAALFKETWRKHFLMVLWHGKSCKEMLGKILRTGEQNNSTDTQSRNFMYWRPSTQGRRNRICWRSVKSMLTNCSEMPAFGSSW